MPNIVIALRDEIRRLARKEVRAAVEAPRKAAAKHRQEIASLKARVTALERKIAALEKSDAKRQPRADEPGERKTRFAPKGVVAMRDRLGISAVDLAGLVGVSAQTIYNWERGTTRPGPAQIAKLASLRGAGKREVKAMLADGR